MDGIAVVVSRASELRVKINDCIDEATQRRNQFQNGNSDHRLQRDEEEEADEEDDEATCLLNIRDALESLEAQLASLQVLQQQQRYEKEATLAEIDCSRMFLLKKLKEYKGVDLDVIREAAAFAGEKVEHDDDLLLPPYPSRLPVSIVSDDNYNSHFPSIPNKYSRSGSVADVRHETNKDMVGAERQAQSDGKGFRPTGIKLILRMAAKTVFTLVSVISVLSLAGFEPKLQKRSTEFKVLNLFQKPAVEEGDIIECPPGKVLVMEDGKPRCLVKERVEIPFEPVVAKPDISYGCG